MDLAEKEQQLKEVAAEVEKCERCALHFSRKKSVPGEGPASAEVVFIGEAPGFHENEQGRPFIGQAGKLLDELLQAAGLDRGKVFITNVVKSRPPGNRDPLPDELAACAPFLDRQLAIIHPRLIVTLGRFSMAHFTPDAKIGTAHGQATWVNGHLVVAMYHPAAALHQPALKSTLEQDFARLPAYIEQAKQAAKPEDEGETPPPPQQDIPPTQLSLF